jgi:hypothetical protein
MSCQLVAFLAQQAPLPDHRQISERAEGVAPPLATGPPPGLRAPLTTPTRQRSTEKVRASIASSRGE